MNTASILNQTVIPAQAGIQKPLLPLSARNWTPACAGVTAKFFRSFLQHPSTPLAVQLPPEPKETPNA
jgi:hypothetical protein